MAGLGNSKKFDAVEEVELLVMDKPMVVIEEEHLGDRFPVMLPRCTERKPSIKRRVVTRDEPLPDPLPDPLSSMNEREPPPYRSITNDSISRCYQDQVDGKIPSGFETEEDLKKVLREGDFDAIEQKVTPKTLARCKSNTLLKAFQVSKQLRDLAHDANPEKDDLEMLEKSIDGFTSALIDPLKADADTRNTFQSCFDDVVDEAIDMKQKKFISHPVVYNLLKSRWYRSFFKVRKESWRTPKRWGYLFLNLWTVFDIAFFPLLFAIFFVLHKIKRALRAKREPEDEHEGIDASEQQSERETIEGKNIYEKYKDYFTTPYFVFFRDTLSYLTLLGLHFAICLSPSTVAFSQLEWVILVFYLGRVLMEADQFFRNKKAGIKERKDGYQPVDAGDGDILQTKLTHYFSDHWNVVDFIILVFYLITFVLRIITWKNSTEVSDNRLLAVSGYLYGFIAMLLTLRAFGQVSERVRGMGEIQIALFFVMRDVMTILWQFLATILAFSLAMTKVYVAEKAYTSGKDSAKDLACSESGLICWWTMATHLGWSLLHLANLDAFNSVDGPSVSLIHVLYCFFLIMAVILLANMMIALLSNSYQRVQDNALQEWSFKRAITVRTYSTYHPIPVPFNLLSIPLIALWNLCRKCSCKTSSDSPDSPEGGRREALDKVVKKLQTMYFEKYGYEFPLAEGKKIDHLVQENEGSRKLTNQIVWQVFRPRGNKEEKLASGKSAWYDSPGISVDGCLLTYLGSDFCDTCKRGEPKEIHSAKFKSPFTLETPRFEVLIQETGERRIVALGVVHKFYDCHEMPGWYTGTVGYHVDDGKIFDTGCHKHGREVEGAMAYRGDLIACEVDFGEASKGKITVFFTLNGKEVEHSSMEYTSGKELFPFVSLGFKGITVLTKMCHRDRGRFSRVTNEEIQEEIGTLRGDVQHLLVEQERMFSEMRNLILLSKEVKDKEEQEETT